MNYTRTMGLPLLLILYGFADPSGEGLTSFLLRHIH